MDPSKQEIIDRWMSEPGGWRRVVACSVNPFIKNPEICTKDILGILDKYPDSSEAIIQHLFAEVVAVRVREVKTDSERRKVVAKTSQEFSYWFPGYDFAMVFK